MNVDNIPEAMKRVMKDHNLTVSQKMVTFMAFMPTLPDDPKTAGVWRDNVETGKVIKRLIDEGKIRIGKLNKKSILEIVHL